MNESFNGINKDGYSFKPLANIKENEKDFVIDMAVPGFDKKDFDLKIEENTLIISSEVKQENETTEENYTRKEFTYTSFSRRFTLPKNVNQEAIEATYNNGILSVIIPKKEEVKLLKSIEVK